MEAATQIQPVSKRRDKQAKRPTTAASRLEAELWAVRLGHCSEWQLDKLPGHADGIPNKFRYHPLQFVDHKESANIEKQPKGGVAERTTERGARFYMDFGFMRASAED